MLLLTVCIRHLNVSCYSKFFTITRCDSAAAMGAKENSEVNKEGRLDRSTYFVKESVNGIGESNFEPVNFTLSLHDSEECSMGKKNLKIPKESPKKESGGNYLRSTKGSIGRQGQNNQKSNGLKKSYKPNKVVYSVIKVGDKSPVKSIVPLRSSELCACINDKTIEAVKEIDFLDGASIRDQNVVNDDSIIGTEVNNLDDVKASSYQKVEDMEIRIEMLEEELRDVAALEIALYSFVPEHGSSVHKVHTPARRLARLYTHTRKHSNQNKCATVAKNTVSGLALIAKSCGNDVPRLTFWLSNTVVLREIISQGFVSVRSNVDMSPADSDSCTVNSSSQLHLLKFKKSSEDDHLKELGFGQQVNDWLDTSTFISALEKLESWIFFRSVESVWCQAFAPHMHSPDENLHHPKSCRELLEPSLGDLRHGNFSINLWRSAFHDALSRLCPVRSGGHDCGCLPVLARLVMEQCVGRLDVAMFNAILRESANEMPTDPNSDSIVDPKVLPIPAGHLNFRSGAQLKNAIGSWVRWMEEFLGMDVDSSGNGNINEGDDSKRGDYSINCFCFLNELSNLLMLPKEMLLDKTIRNEVCPSIGVPLIIRVLRNFTPDEFCPDPVPSIVLEELNSKSLIDRSPSSHEEINMFPHTASPLPLPHFIEKLVVPDKNLSELQREIPMVLRKGYTSDEELDHLHDPLASFIDRIPLVSPAMAGDIILEKQVSVPNVRYNLLRKVWCD